MARKNKIIKNVESRLGQMIPEKKKVKKVEISEIVHRIPANARFGMIIAVAILWVNVIRLAFLNLFSYLAMPMSNIVTEIIIATIVTVIIFIIFIIFNSWVSISRKLGHIRINIKVRPRVGNNAHHKKRR